MNAADRQRTSFYALLVACALLRFIVAVADQGLIWPDEIYQSVEPAHRLVFGIGLPA